MINRWRISIGKVYIRIKLGYTMLAAMVGSMFNPVIIAILIAVLYSLMVHHLAPDAVWGWRHTFVATVVSVVFAVAIGVALFNHQTNVTDRARTRQFRASLSAEISDIIREISSGNFMTIHLSTSSQKVLITYIQPLILEDAARSGLFNSVHTENMLHLAQKIRMYNIKVSYLFSVLTAGSSKPAFEPQTLHAIQNVEETRKAIIEDSHFLLKQMDLPLSPSVKPI